MANLSKLPYLLDVLTKRPSSKITVSPDPNAKPEVIVGQDWTPTTTTTTKKNVPTEWDPKKKDWKSAGETTEESGQQAVRETEIILPSRMTDPKTATEQDLHDLVRIMISQSDRAEMGPAGQYTQDILEESDRILRTPKERATGQPANIEDFMDPSKAGSAEQAIIGMADAPLFREGKVQTLKPPEEVLKENRKLLDEVNADRIKRDKKPFDPETVNLAIASSQQYRRLLASEIGVPFDQVRSVEDDVVTQLAKANASKNQSKLENIIRNQVTNEQARQIPVGSESLLDAIFNQPRRIKGISRYDKNDPASVAPFASESAQMKGAYGAYRPEGGVNPNMAIAEVLQGRPGSGPDLAQLIAAGRGLEGIGGTPHTGFGRRAGQQKLMQQLNRIGEESGDVSYGRTPQGIKKLEPDPDPRYDKSPELPPEPDRFTPFEDTRTTSGGLSEIDYMGEISSKQIDDVAEQLRARGINDPDAVIEEGRKLLSPAIDREKNFELVARVRESLAELQKDIGTGRNFVRAKPGREEFGDVARTIGRKSETEPSFVDEKGQQRYRVTKKGTLGMSSDEISRQQKLRALVDDANSALDRADQIGDPALTRQLGSAIASGDTGKIQKAIQAIPSDPSQGTVFGGSAPALKGRVTVQQYESQIFKLNKQLDKLRERAKNTPAGSEQRKEINAEGIKLKRRIADLEEAKKTVEESTKVSPQTRRTRKEQARVAEDLRRTATQAEGSESTARQFGEDAEFTGTMDEALEQGAEFNQLTGGNLRDDLMSYGMPDVEFAGSRAANVGEPVNPNLQRKLATNELIRILLERQR